MSHCSPKFATRGSAPSRSRSATARLTSSTSVTSVGLTAWVVMVRATAAGASSVGSSSIGGWISGRTDGSSICEFVHFRQNVD